RSQQKRKFARLYVSNRYHKPAKALLGIKSWVPCVYLSAKLTYFRRMLDSRPGTSTDKPPVLNLLVILLMVGLGFVIVGPIVGYLLAMPFYNGDVDLLEAIGTSQFSEDIKLPFYIIQGAATVFGLILTPMVYLATRRRKLGDLFSSEPIGLLPILVTGFVVIAFMGINSVFIEWNANVNFPDFAKGFERWAREREDALAELTQF